MSRKGSKIGSTRGLAPPVGLHIYKSERPILIPGALFLGAIGIIFFLRLSAPHPAHSQTLDQEIKHLLDNDCAALTGGGRGPLVGTRLDFICTTATVGDATGVSSGGGSGSAPSLGVTVENRRKVRLEGEEDKKRDESTLGATFSLGKGVSLFVSGNFEALNRDVATFADGFDSTISGGTVGGDYRVNDRLLAGAAFNFTNSDGDFDGGGDFNTDSFGIILFGSFLPAPGFFADAAAGFTHDDYKVSRAVSYQEGGIPRRLSGTTTSDTDGDTFSARALFGYDHPFGSVIIGPRAGVNYTNTHIDGYTESGGDGLALTYADQSVNSVQSVLGLQGSVARYNQEVWK